MPSAGPSAAPLSAAQRPSFDGRLVFPRRTPAGVQWCGTALRDSPHEFRAASMAPPRRPARRGWAARRAWAAALSSSSRRASASNAVGVLTRAPLVRFSGIGSGRALRLWRWICRSSASAEMPEALRGGRAAELVRPRQRERSHLHSVAKGIGNCVEVDQGYGDSDLTVDFGREHRRLGRPRSVERCQAADPGMVLGGRHAQGECRGGAERRPGGECRGRRECRWRERPGRPPIAKRTLTKEPHTCCIGPDDG